MLLAIGFLFVNNMLLMILPERFAAYFSNMGGSLPAADHPVLLPRYLHMMTGAVAVGGLFVALAGRFQADRDPELAAQARDVGMQTFFWGTAVNVLNGLWFLLAQPREIMLIFMGGNLPATICFTAALLVVAVMLFTAWKKRLWPTFWLALTVVFLMTFLRAWLRAGYLQEVFNLGQLQVVPEYSPMWFFFATLLLGLVCIAWMLKKTAEAMANS